ncbi:CHASE2 domain-containing protein [Crenothrix sp.]|uniref:CHASE2 domain-containing protein n=1 Tax=Crenothrix sp. TaxID=3100433 RepID=UPI00374CDB05
MKLHLLRTITIALITFLLGSGVDYFASIETTVGLDSLFKIRGVRQAPAEVVVVAMDEASEIRLGVGQDLTRWRGFHSKLIQQLQHQGVALIIFDLQFITPHANHDGMFAAAIRKAGNVLVTDCVQKLLRGDEGFEGWDECSEDNREPFVKKETRQEKPLSDQLIAMRKIVPTAKLAQSVLDHAPFYLTNDADNSIVREGWIFLDALAESPTLPVVAWLYYLQRTGELKGVALSNMPFSTWLIEQRRQCLPNSQKTSHPDKKSQLEQLINNIVCLEDTRYLDFYGPPQTLRMESYADVYEGKINNLHGKVIFVGKANRHYLSGKTDFFQTPFTNTRSGKIAGVEIMATQFANLLENRFITSVCPQALWYVVFGLLAGLLLTQFAGLLGIAVSVLLSGMYVGLAVWLFKRSGLWLPIAVPLLIQLPVAWLLSLLWSRRDLLNERKRLLAFVRQVFPQWIHFIPTSPGQWYAEKSTEALAFERDVNGLCLATDIEGYTTVAAEHTPHEMWELLNDYYQVLSNPVTSHKGIIADVTGDAMMAVWIDSPPATQRLAACLAALEMGVAVDRFNETTRVGRLPTRIGLHEGDMTLGKLKAGEGSHYRAIGDTVNIASRIQGANKYLGTKILASAPFAANLTTIVSRPVGLFRLMGKDEPLALLEIVGIGPDVSLIKNKICHQFAYGLVAFQQGQWDEAAISFETLLNAYGEDGPSRFYLNLALAYQKKPPLEWDGIVIFEGK